jgi:hypothetical protein
VKALAVAGGFLDRVGGALVRPRDLPDSIDARHGLGDLGVLLAMRVVADELPRIARGVLAVPSLGARSALHGLVAAASTAVPDLVAVLIGAVALALFSGRARTREGGAGELDLAAYAWVPFLAVRLVAALAFTALQARPAEWVEIGANLIGVAWAVAVWTLALLALRRPPTPSSGAPS